MSLHWGSATPVCFSLHYFGFLSLSSYFHEHQRHPWTIFFFNNQMFIDCQTAQERKKENVTEQKDPNMPHWALDTFDLLKKKGKENWTDRPRKGNCDLWPFSFTRAGAVYQDISSFLPPGVKSIQERANGWQLGVRRREGLLWRRRKRRSFSGALRKRRARRLCKWTGWWWLILFECLLLSFSVF